MRNSTYRVLLDELIWEYHHLKAKKSQIGISFDELTEDEQLHLALQYTLSADKDEKYEILAESLTCMPYSNEDNSGQIADSIDSLWSLLLAGKSDYLDKMNNLILSYLRRSLSEEFDEALMDYYTNNNNNYDCDLDIWRDDEIGSPLTSVGPFQQQHLGVSDER